MKGTFIALLRGVNVGGANCLPNDSLVKILESLGLSRVRTYIQSGNAIFQAETRQSAPLPEKIKAAIQRKHGFAPEVMIISFDDLQQAMSANPYRGADANPQGLHLAFMASAPANPDLSSLEPFRAPTEEYTLRDKVLYLWAPEGIGRSKLFPRMDKALKVPTTARNWRTVGKLLELARELATTAAPDETQGPGRAHNSGRSGGRSGVRSHAKTR